MKMKLRLYLSVLLIVLTTIRCTPRNIPIRTQVFVSTSGRTIIQYYAFKSGTCGTGTNCNFHGILPLPPGFAQVEVFLTGFTLEAGKSEEKVKRILAEVKKHQYSTSSGELEVEVTGRFETETMQPYSYQISFVVLLTNAAALLTNVGNTCKGVAQCIITASLPGSIPPTMQYIGLGTRIFDLSSTSEPLSVNALSMHVDPIRVQAPNVQVDYSCVLRDARSSNEMRCQWEASVIAFDPAEMDRNDSNVFPQFTIVGSNVPSAKQLNSQAKPFSGGTIAGYFDALEGISLFYGRGQENQIWLIDGSASGFNIIGSGPSTGEAQYGVFLGTTFMDRVKAQPFSLQVSRAVGLLR
jgi:hypothetical protein